MDLSQELIAGTFMDTTGISKTYTKLADISEWTPTQRKRIMKEFKYILEDIAELPNCATIPHKFKVYYVLIQLEHAIKERDLLNIMSEITQIWGIDDIFSNENESPCISVELWTGRFKIVYKKLLELNMKLHIFPIDVRIWTNILYLYAQGIRSRRVSENISKKLLSVSLELALCLDNNPSESLKTYLHNCPIKDFYPYQLYNVNWDNIDSIVSDISSKESIILRHITSHQLNMQPEQKASSVIIFTDQDIENFIDQYFMVMYPFTNTKNMKNKLRSLMDQNTTLYQICHIPLILETVCYSIERIMRLENNDIIYFIRIILTQLLMAYTIKFKLVDKRQLFDFLDDDVDNTCNNEILLLEHYALAHFINSTPNIQATLDYVQEITSLKDDNVWIKSQLYIGLLEQSNGTYKFIHPVFRDYFLARFLVSCMSEKSPHNFTRALITVGVSPMPLDSFMKEYIICQDNDHILTFIKELINSNYELSQRISILEMECK